MLAAAVLLFVPYAAPVNSLMTVEIRPGVENGPDLIRVDGRLRVTPGAEKVKFTFTAGTVTVTAGAEKVAEETEGRLEMTVNRTLAGQDAGAETEFFGSFNREGDAKAMAEGLAQIFEGLHSLVAAFPPEAGEGFHAESPDAKLTVVKVTQSRDTGALIEVRLETPAMKGSYTLSERTGFLTRMDGTLPDKGTVAITLKPVPAGR